MKMMQREHYKAKYGEAKRDREETRRWEEFLKNRAEFDEAIMQQLDAYDFMVQSMEGRY